MPRRRAARRRATRSGAARPSALTSASRECESRTGPGTLRSHIPFATSLLRDKVLPAGMGRRYARDEGPQDTRHKSDAKRSSSHRAQSEAQDEDRNQPTQGRPARGMDDRLGSVRSVMRETQNPLASAQARIASRRSGGPGWLEPLRQTPRAHGCGSRAGPGCSRH